MTSKNLTTGVEVKSITYPRQQREGGSVHDVTIDPADHLMRCTCKAGEFGQLCWAQKNVMEGKAGRPIVRVRCHPAPLPKARRARTSEAGRDLAMQLDT